MVQPFCRASLSGEPPGEPSQHIANRGKVMVCNRGAASDVDRKSTRSVDYGETVLVGDVIADEHRQAPAKWRVSQKTGDRSTLAGRLWNQLDHHLSRNRRKRAVARLRCPSDERTATRR